ncbi:maltooligosyl trehalose synthase [Pseudarthrobacter enclensis]|uniref:Maltooligosyl trehalose synthase n=1 Tax=Pseudarthrobacter enclensis TaxID=993070 RepID=A0A0V8IW52_9MICC|nr:malto-oligosyltrehalose synthase [Pseudarthrobacter enclensis]KSU78949.1 maltooligosyl trehalose synthase [Pseudarthrobacter enclensis]SCB80207.1 maltooligosyl trehalose synthase [Pseudarthrobacter enclensis]
MRTPASTYRLQIRKGFTLFDAADTVPYLKSLGVDWVYLSPILTAEQGSDHGYDVTDPSAVDPERGGPEGLLALSKAARDHGMGVLVDIVPNHVGVATPVQNPWWWSLLKEGRQSPYADAFDVDWDLGGGKVRLPMLGSDADLDKLELKDGELRYYDHRFPVADGTWSDGDSPQEVHSRQHYQLMDWRRADAELNYRRFFAVTTLAGIRVEDPQVFEEAHAEVGRWFTDGLVDGLRVDHPDGLADPAGYLRWLKDLTGGAYVLVEKILEPGEVLPGDFACEGTTGYDALADVDRAFVDPAGQAGLDALDADLRGTPQPADYAEMIRGTKRMIADGILRSEVLRLARLVPESHGLELEQAADAVAEIIASFPVYRTYLPTGADVLKEACESAAEHRPDLAVAVGTLLPLLLDPANPIAVRFQQTSGMVMAKGVEDTAFYRYTRLGTLTEVGAEPTEFAVSPEEFHRRMRRRQDELPLSMTTMSTHDTKRSEDARARISVIAEVPGEWAATLDTLRKLAPIPDGPYENLLWQAIIGAWPASRERLQGYAEKAAREAGNSTKWTDPDEDFESKVKAAVDAVFDDAGVARVVEDFVARIDAFAASNSLSAKLVQLTMPGVPDVYQGSEFWERSLTDPDNRRPVDFAAREAELAKIDAGTLPAAGTEASKLLAASRALRLRRDRPELFRGYIPVTATGAAAGHLLAFSRGVADGTPGALTLATRLPAGLEADGGWRDTAVVLPAAMRDELTGAAHGPGSVLVSDLLGTYPVALLVPADGGNS